MYTANNQNDKRYDIMDIIVLVSLLMNRDLLIWF